MRASEQQREQEKEREKESKKKSEEGTEQTALSTMQFSYQGVKYRVINNQKKRSRTGRENVLT